MKTTNRSLYRIKYLFGEILRRKGNLPLDNPVFLENKLLGVFRKHFSNAYKEVYDKLINRGTLTAIMQTSYNESTGEFDTSYLKSFLKQHYNAVYTIQMRDEVDDIIEESWYLGENYIRSQFDREIEELSELSESRANRLSTYLLLGATLGAVDQIIIPVVERAILQTITESLQRELVQQGIEVALANTVWVRDEIYHDMMSIWGVNAAKNYGRVSGVGDLDISGYFIWNTAGDEKVCGECEILDTMRFDVGDVVSHMEAYLNAEDENEARELHPWPSRLDGDSFVMSNGSRVHVDVESLIEGHICVPPLHGGCRCDLEFVPA